MANNLLIVESPAKAKTINKYLGKEFEVLASYGHVRDLIPKEGAVNPSRNFEMSYEVIEKNDKHVNAIARAAKKAHALYLATDLDREGEAISWHIYEILKERGLADKPVYRVVFSEITPKAIREAIESPRELSLDLINAQQARRALDYLVGFNLSPLLWRKVRRGLSAGRVQSPALRMIVEREEEIEKFNPREYWTVEADLQKDDHNFLGRLTHFAGDKLDQFDIADEKRAGDVRQALMTAATAQGSAATPHGALLVQKVKKTQRKRRPAPPFITSTLQQDAARKLGFTTRRTMRVAQQLYEGVNVDGDSQGLITYMRTDSVHLSNDAIAGIRGVIEERFGKDKLPESPNFYKTKAKNAQEAHEAIRPTSPHLQPEKIKGSLDGDQLKLYRLIWNRAVASQMTHALMNTVSVDLRCGDGNLFRTSGSVIVEPGFLAVYEETPGGKGKTAKEDEKRLPPMEEGEVVALKQEVRAEQHFTEPPPRYSEASLVKALEEYGIGRPSTYASIISTLLNREYVELDRKRFMPTDVGRVVAKFLSNHFTQYVDYDFTARLEDTLDDIAKGDKEWVPVLTDFWSPFKDLVEEKDANVTRDEASSARQLGTDPKTGKPVSVRMGRYGPFVQIGTRDDEEKPQFAGLRPGQKMDKITYEEAMELFKLPRKLGETPEGEPVSTSIGRFGPYVKYGSKFVSMKEDDPYTVTLERALELVAAKKEADANRIIQDFNDGEVQVLNGRYGPYITDGHKNGKIPKDREPKTLTLEECLEILEAAPEPRRKKKKKVAKKTAKKKAAKKTTKKKAKKKTKKKATRKKAKKKAKKATSAESA